MKSGERWTRAVFSGLRDTRLNGLSDHDPVGQGKSMVGHGVAKKLNIRGTSARMPTGVHVCRESLVLVLND